MRQEAKITSKGQVTVPIEIRRRLGVDCGDRLVFEDDGDSVTVRPARRTSRFAMYKGIGNPDGRRLTREEIVQLVRGMRDDEDRD